jgi:hypothetical protein
MTGTVGDRSPKSSLRTRFFSSLPSIAAPAS